MELFGPDEAKGVVMNYGWVCPRCGTVWNPNIMSCSCRPSFGSEIGVEVTPPQTPYTTGDPIPPYQFFTTDIGDQKEFTVIKPLGG